jgi:hypothetical protein
LYLDIVTQPHKTFHPFRFREIPCRKVYTLAPQSAVMSVTMHNDETGSCSPKGALYSGVLRSNSLDSFVTCKNTPADKSL